LLTFFHPALGYTISPGGYFMHKDDGGPISPGGSASGYDLLPNTISEPGWKGAGWRETSVPVSYVIPHFEETSKLRK